MRMMWRGGHLLESFDVGTIARLHPHRGQVGHEKSVGRGGEFGLDEVGGRGLGSAEQFCCGRHYKGAPWLAAQLIDQQICLHLLAIQNFSASREHHTTQRDRWFWRQNLCGMFGMWKKELFSNVSSPTRWPQQILKMARSILGIGECVQSCLLRY